MGHDRSHGRCCQIRTCWRSGSCAAACCRSGTACEGDGPPRWPLHETAGWRVVGLRGAQARWVWRALLKSFRSAPQRVGSGAPVHATVIVLAAPGDAHNAGRGAGGARAGRRDSRAQGGGRRQHSGDQRKWESSGLCRRRSRCGSLQGAGPRLQSLLAPLDSTTGQTLPAAPRRSSQLGTTSRCRQGAGRPSAPSANCPESSPPPARAPGGLCCWRRFAWLC